MQAKDIMATAVISVRPDASVREVATLLLDERVSGVPVLEDGRLLGIVSEADLLHRHEIGTERDTPADPWWVRLFRAEGTPSRYIKAHATKAKDLMTREIVSVAEDTPLDEIATLFDSRGIRRVPVVRAGKVTGIVTRASLVRALAAHPAKPRKTSGRNDEAIRSELVAELERQAWWRTDWSSVTVTDGVVHFWGFQDSPDEGNAARVAAENVPGVRRVEDHRQRYSDLPVSL
jgi:CBS domain-containing protein